MSEFDEIGYWSEVKLDIVKKYANEYSKILSARENPAFNHVYIDAFAGPGVNISRTTGEYIPGSPLNALNVNPPFMEYYFIDIEEKRAEALQEMVQKLTNVHIYQGDCNKILLDKIFPNVRYEDYRRGLCLLDPYGLHLEWDVIEKAGKMGSLEIFLNFPIADINRNVLLRNPDKVNNRQLQRMNKFWGDEGWRNIVYSTRKNLFWNYKEKTADNETIAEAFRQRLRQVAGFKYVPKPIPMRNSKGAIIYYLFFASQKPVADRIVKYIFDKYRQKGA